ncbi:DUF6080 domain-containing protein [Prevotella scopos]|uniref:DUF6080 domain-containing protein n=1 Tax=Prevotella scopos TaxID=589437 RepID=UPI000AD11D38|nr:DUF6080 domain-containing protein [Prevotella scopos]
MPGSILSFLGTKLAHDSYNYGLFTRGGNLGFWGLFFDHYTVSGFDNLSYMTMSRWKIYYQLYRHPLLPTFFYPFYLLNHWLMDLTGRNNAIFIEAFFNVLAATYSCLFIYRIFVKVQELRRKDALLLTVFFFSFASILLTVFVPDHFIFTLFFLTMTLYLAGRAMKREKSSMKAWQTMLLSFFAAGITFTNIAKIGLADLFVNGKKTFRIKHFFISFILPLCALFAIYSYQQQAFVEPDAKVQAKVKEKKLKKDLKFAAKYEKQHEFMKSRTGTQVANNRFFEWTDLSSSRTDAVVENLFGESLQLHQKHVLEDVNKSRPIIVRYSCVLNYIAEAIIILLFLGGIIVGRKDKFLQLCMAWFATDIALHIILGFGIIEVYIMGAHWLFIIPIAISYLFKRIKQRRVLIGARLFIAALTLALIVYNLSLIIPYMLRGFVAPH